MKPFQTTTHDKKRPIEERIAAGMGKSAYVDLRDGVGGTNPMKLTDQDIFAALGIVSDRRGRVAAQVLETYYGSTLIHRRALLKAWEERERKPGDAEKRTILIRWGGEVGVRILAGWKSSSDAFDDFAYLACSRRQTLQEWTRLATAWLEGERAAALAELRSVLRDRVALEARKKLKPHRSERPIALAS